MKLTCSRCNKRISRKHARMIDGKVLCSACVFGPRPTREEIVAEAIEGLRSDLAGITWPEPKERP